jgi:hypothetical protein
LDSPLEYISDDVTFTSIITLHCLQAAEHSTFFSIQISRGHGPKMDSGSSKDTLTIPFTQLPKEIRLLVFEATFEPQYILLKFVEGRRPNSNIPVYAYKPYDDPKPPIALQVCQESRNLALQRYRRWNFRWYLHDRVERSKVVCIFWSFLSMFNCLAIS